MKVAFAPLFALLSLAPLAAVVRGDSTSETFPGRCTATKDCATYGAGLECIAVDSSTAGLSNLNMCIAKGTICSGSIAGRCPTFSSWPASYRKVQTVCAFTVVPNCNKKIEAKTKAPSTGSGDDDATDETDAGSSDAGVGSAPDNTTVECYVRNFTVGDEFKVVNGIYQCQDARKYVAGNGGHLTNLTQTQMIACGGNASSANPTLCNGQGTCSPKTAFAQEYECKCNSGYTGDKFCASATSNECSNLGQCGTSGTCVLQTATSGTCSCKNGATGNQCAACDPKASTVCSGKGTCSADGVCVCKSGYTGTQCADTASSGGSGGSGGSSDAIGTHVKSIAATLAMAAAIGAMVFA